MQEELWKEAMDFMRQHGIDWPSHAMARMGDLIATNDAAELARWKQIVVLLDAFHRPDILH